MWGLVVWWLFLAVLGWVLVSMRDFARCCWRADMLVVRRWGIDRW